MHDSGPARIDEKTPKVAQIFAHCVGGTAAAAAAAAAVAAVAAVAVAVAVAVAAAVAGSTHCHAFCGSEVATGYVKISNIVYTLHNDTT